MKKLFSLIAIAILATSATHAQDITNKLGDSGHFYVQNKDGNNLIDIYDSGFNSIFKHINFGTESTQFEIYNAGHNNKLEFYKAHNTAVTPTKITDGTAMGIIGFNGFNTSNYFSSSAIISAIVDGADGTHLPGKLQFSTGTSTAAAIPRMTIESNGRVNIATVLKLTPGAAPASPEKGDIYFDDATTKAKCYDGTTWQDLW